MLFKCCQLCMAEIPGLVVKHLSITLQWVLACSTINHAQEFLFMLFSMLCKAISLDKSYPLTNVFLPKTTFSVFWVRSFLLCLIIKLDKCKFILASPLVAYRLLYVPGLSGNEPRKCVKSSLHHQWCVMIAVIPPLLAKKDSYKW